MRAPALIVGLGLLLLCGDATSAPAPRPRPTAKAKAKAPAKGTRPVLRRVGGNGAKAVRTMLARAKKKRPKVSFSPCSASVPEEAAQGKLAPGAEGLVAEVGYLWPNGSTINVHFMDGTPEARAAVAEIVPAWTDHANVKFQFFLDPDQPPTETHVRVTFDDAACNAALGTSGQYRIPTGEPTMRLCHLDQQVGSTGFQRVVLHEFGHVLGMHHEHQSPKVNIKWNKPAVYDYYAAIGWDHAYTDQWVFRQIDPSIVDASEYDSKSIMHYSFPAEFTTDRVEIIGAHELSELDKKHIAKLYPGGGTKKQDTRFFERVIALRNDTSKTIDVKLAYRTKGKKGWHWTPGGDPEAANKIVRVAPGEQTAIGGDPTAKRVRWVAASMDGKQTWSEHRVKSIETAPKEGYLEREQQTYVIAIDGPPDAPSLGVEELYEAAEQALDDGKPELARARFAELVRRFPKHSWVPWARLGIVSGWLDEPDNREAVLAAYDLINDFPEHEASGYAWFYGGIASLGMGKCADARAYFDYVMDPAFGLPKDWREAGAEYRKQAKAGSKLCK